MTAIAAEIAAEIQQLLAEFARSSVCDFWQAPGNGLIINLAHVVSVDRLGPDLRVTTVCPGLVLTVKASSQEERGLLAALAERIKRPRPVESAPDEAPAGSR